METPALKYNGTDYLVSQERGPTEWWVSWVRFVVDWIGRL